MEFVSLLDIQLEDSALRLLRKELRQRSRLAGSAVLSEHLFSPTL